MAKNILIVDDQKDIVMILDREFCRNPDYQVSVAYSLTEALDTIGRKAINLVISDVRIGTDSGFTLAKMLRELYPKVGVMLMSAYRSTANREQSELLGVVQFIEKPFVISKLVADVATYFTKVEEAAKPKPAPVVPPPPVEKEKSPAVTGGLQHFKPQDLVQLFCLNGRAIAISVSSVNNDRVGHIYIQRGQVQHAELNDLTGDQAFNALMHIPNSKVMVKDWDQPVPQTITSNWEHLLLFSAVEADENLHNVPQHLRISQTG